MCVCARAWLLCLNECVCASPQGGTVPGHSVWMKVIASGGQPAAEAQLRFCVLAFVCVCVSALVHETTSCVGLSPSLGEHFHLHFDKKTARRTKIGSFLRACVSMRPPGRSEGASSKASFIKQEGAGDQIRDRKMFGGPVQPGKGQILISRLL